MQPDTIDFTSFSTWKEHAAQNHKSLVEVLLEHEKAVHGKDRVEVIGQMRQYLRHIREAASRSLFGENQSIKSRLLILDGADGARVNLASQTPFAQALGIIPQAQAISLATSEWNACGMAILKAPTAGSVGVIPGVFLAVLDGLHLSEDQLVEGMLIASAIGKIIFARATFAAAEAGCGAEVGSATAMAAGGIAWMLSQDADVVESSASFGLQQLIGLECSSLAGAVEEPCAPRCAIGATIALGSANLALSGMRFKIPLDEVITVMGEVGRSLPESLRETQKGGLANTPTGRKLALLAVQKRRQQLACQSCSSQPPVSFQLARES